MAKLFELKDEILKGRRVTRKAWNTTRYEVLGFFSAHPEDIFADDWELESLPKVKKKITMYQVIYSQKITADNTVIYASGKLYETKEDFYKNSPDCKVIKLITHVIEIDE